MPGTFRHAYVLVLAAILFLPQPATAQLIYPVQTDHQQSFEALMTGWSVAISGAVQYWDLGSMETIIANNAENLGTQGFELESKSFGFGPGFGVEIGYRYGGKWIARGAMEWTRFKVEDRYGDEVPVLGGGNPFFSIGYSTVVDTRFFLASLGLQRSHRVKGMALSWGAAGVIAPVRVTEKYETWSDTEPSAASQEVTSKGTGFGLEGMVTVDYLLDGPNTIFVEGFGRVGKTTVEAENQGFDGDLTPGKRDVEFTGAGFRLGVRFN